MGADPNILFLAAEAEPFIKVGGLGDVAGSLARFLHNLPAISAPRTNTDVRLLIPMHAVIRTRAQGYRSLMRFSVPHAAGPIAAHVFEAQLEGLPVYLLDAEPIAQSGSVYSSDPALDASKYAFFSMAALEFIRQFDWRCNIIHANDWHTALACYGLLLRRREGEFGGVASVLTVHNLPFMGPDVSSLLAGYGLAQVQTGLPAWASALPLALGLWSADAIVAVSPTYAFEIQTPKFGNGLENYLRARRESLHGILNGIDIDLFDPAIDPAIGSNFGVATLERRALNKAALQVRLQLAVRPEVPLLGVVSRIDPQKGTDLLAPALRRLRDRSWQAVVLGTGMPRLEHAMKKLELEFPERVRAVIRYDAGLARQIYAGADMLLMPSRYEPCGLAQMIAMRYGCIPIVSAVGGLRDTVVDGKSGFVIKSATAARLAAAIKRGIGLLADRPAWVEMQQNAMSQDFSWAVSASRYFQLYTHLLSQVAAIESS